MRAIKENGHNLLAAVDKNDSVGVIDSFFPEAAFFTEFERFERHLQKLKREGTQIDYVTVCSPNYLHDAHIRFGLHLGADVICEKPLVLNPWNLEALKDIELESRKKVYTILQLRLHPSIRELKRRVEKAGKDKTYDILLSYITSRGKWYYTSWKGEENKSGGIATNIGIHFFDMLQWIFGRVVSNEVHLHTHDRASGYLELEQARVKWFLSINAETLPEEVRKKGGSTYRSISVDDEEFEFSGGFNDLHTLSYEAILDGWGFCLDDACQAIELAYDIRNASPQGIHNDIHPMSALPLCSHPFEREELAAAMLYRASKDL